MDVAQVRAEAEQYNGQFAILGGDWSPFWHDAIDLFGMESLCIKMHTEPEVVEAALRYVVDYYAAVNQRIFDAAGDVIDIFFIGNDFGSQKGPLIGPGLFAHFILPHLKRPINLNTVKLVVRKTPLGQ